MKSNNHSMYARMESTRQCCAEKMVRLNLWTSCPLSRSQTRNQVVLVDVRTKLAVSWLGDMPLTPRWNRPNRVCSKCRRFVNMLILSFITRPYSSHTVGEVLTTLNSGRSGSSYRPSYTLGLKGAIHNSLLRWFVNEIP